jgi:predicted AAA+ superfamily ATPase
MTHKIYYKRIADGLLEERLHSSGAILIEGPKWCGKKATATRASKSQLYMQDPDKALSYLKAADTKPSLLLQGETPRLLDEWQSAPVLWDAVRFMVDQRGGLPGQFILTGSSVPKDGVVKHTGTGRISRLTMRPMSLYESLESNGGISLKDIFDGNKKIECYSDLTIEKIAFAIVRGGWPASVGVDEKIALRHAVDYVEAVINADISRVDGVEKSPVRVRALMRSLARNISTMATIRTIRDDIALGDADASVSEKTISQYLSALDRIFVTENLPAWNPALRSKTAIRTSAKRHFVDPSIATAVMRLTPSRLLEDFNYFGLLFESLCTRDLRVYAEAIDGQVFHYHDASGLESDTVVCLNDGRWAAIEVKLGAKEIEKAAEHLLKLKEKVNTDKMKEPSFLMILTGTEFAYRRDDGVFVVPIGCLKD